MIIYMDESGNFSPASGGAAVSLVGALVIPEDRLGWITKKYLSMRNTFPLDKGEVKGRLLTEKQVAQVVDMLAKNDVIFDVAAIDMSHHSNKIVEDHKRDQAIAITENLTDKHHPNIHASVWDLRQRLEKMAAQLYLQSTVTFELIPKIIQNGTLYYSQRRPKTLGRFEWIVDAKDKTKVTDWEDWWSFTILPAIQSRSAKEPLMMFEEGDYSHFRRFDTETLDYLPQAQFQREGDDAPSDIKKIMSESLRFSSNPEPGLEMADILSNATRRALMGNLGFAGWSGIRSLMIHQSDHYIRLLTLAPSNPSWTHAPSYTHVLDHFREGGKDLLAPGFRN